MTMRDFLENRRRAEYSTFMKVMKAMPTDRFDYRPHERSPSAADIVWTLARELQACCLLIDEGRMNWTTQAPPADPKAIYLGFPEAL
jgi:hypothetical protein